MWLVRKWVLEQVDPQVGGPGVVDLGWWTWGGGVLLGEEQPGLELLEADVTRG